MLKIEHVGQGEYSCSTLKKQEFEMFIIGDIVKLFYAELYAYACASFPLEKLEEFIKIHKENLENKEEKKR